MPAKTKIPPPLNIGDMNDTQKITFLIEQNTELRQMLDWYEKDNIYALFFAVNRKAGEMATALNGSKISLEGNSVKNFQSMMKDMDETFKSIEKLRNNYLKIDAETAAEMERKGTPLIEQRVTGS